MQTRCSPEDCRIANDRNWACAIVRQTGRAGLYLTNGVFLHRVVRVEAGEAGETVDLEDCYRLDVVCVPVCDLHRRELRVITPSLGEALDAERWSQGEFRRRS